MALVAQWNRIAADLPEGWSSIDLRLGLARPADADRAAVLLGPLGPGRAGDELLVGVSPGGADGPAPFQRLLKRLDEEGIGGTLTLEAPPETADRPQPGDARTPTGLAEAWDRLVTALPADWSDLLCVVELRSSDELAPAALAIAPLNPSRHGASPALRFRVARQYGYGAAPGMARRCLSRLDEAGIPGTIRLLEARSDTRLVATQGPTFVVGNRAV